MLKVSISSLLIVGATVGVGMGIVYLSTLTDIRTELHSRVLNVGTSDGQDSWNLLKAKIIKNKSELFKNINESSSAEEVKRSCDELLSKNYKSFFHNKKELLDAAENNCSLKIKEIVSGFLKKESPFWMVKQEKLKEQQLKKEKMSSKLSILHSQLISKNSQQNKDTEGKYMRLWCEQNVEIHYKKGQEDLLRDIKEYCTINKNR